MSPQIHGRGWKLDKNAMEGISSLSDHTFNAYLKLRDSLTSLGFNSEKAINFSREVDEMEQKVDSLFVIVDLNIVTSGVEIPTILIFRDIAREMESLMNKAREAANHVRLIVH